MRFLATADWQIGAGAVYGTAERPRLADQAEALEAMAELAESRAALTVFAGDACQHRRPSVPELLVLRRALDQLGAVVAIPGNHDVTGPGTPGTLELFGELATLYTRPAVQRVGDVVFGYLPWAHPSTLRAAIGPAGSEEHADAIMRAAADLYELATSPGPHPPLEQLSTVLVTHYALGGVSLPGGLTTSDLVGEPVLDPLALAEQGWDWVLAGHVHTPMHVELETGQPGVWRRFTHVVSLGSPYVCDYGEAELPHGCWLIDTEEGTAEHVPLPDRQFVTMAYEYGAWQEILTGQEAVMVEGAVVRAKVHATPEEAARFDPAELRRVLLAAGAHQVHTIDVQVEREHRARATGLQEDTEPQAALAAWVAAHQVEPERAEALREQLAARLEHRA